MAGWQFHAGHRGYCRECQDDCCASCAYAPPAVLPENREVLEVLTLCGGQWFHGFSGATGLNVDAVMRVADRFGIEVDELFLKKFRVYEAAALAAMHHGKENGPEA